MKKINLVLMLILALVTLPAGAVVLTNNPVFIGTPNAGAGDTLPVAFTKLNNIVSNLQAVVSALTNGGYTGSFISIQVGTNGAFIVNSSGALTTTNTIQGAKSNEVANLIGTTNNIQNSINSNIVAIAANTASITVNTASIASKAGTNAPTLYSAINVGLFTTDNLLVNTNSNFPNPTNTAFGVGIANSGINVTNAANNIGMKITGTGVGTADLLQINRVSGGNAFSFVTAGHLIANTINYISMGANQYMISGGAGITDFRDASFNVGSGKILANTATTATNLASVQTAVVTNFVFAQRYTNTVAGGFASTRAFISASAVCVGTVGGTGKATLFVEHSTIYTNQFQASSGAIAQTTSVPIYDIISPGDVFYFTDGSSAGGSVTIQSGTGVWMGL